MKFEEFRNQLEESKEYTDANEELKLQFDLAEAVLKARLNKGWSQEKLAEVIGTKQANISRIEAGLANPTLKIIKKLATALEFDVNISFGKREEIEYERELILNTSQDYTFNNWVVMPSNCFEFDLESRQSQT